jgi:hypothetical protein
MKRLDIRNGVYLAHPFELAELIQDYANDNLREMMELLYQQFGVVNPASDELRVQVDEGIAPRAFGRSSTYSVLVLPGRAVLPTGPVHVDATEILPFTVDARADVTRFVNLKPDIITDTPQELLPITSGSADIRETDSYRLFIEASPVANLAEGITLASLEVRRGVVTVMDLRAATPARLRYDSTFFFDTVDPELIPAIERLFSREDFVAEVENLFDHKMLRGEEVVTRPRAATAPFFLEMRHEPAFREFVRQLNAAGSLIQPEPNPDWMLRLGWNLYDVTATRLQNDLFQIDTKGRYNLTRITIGPDDDPIFLRFAGESYEVQTIESANTVRLAVNVPAGIAEDRHASLHNGAEEFYVYAEPAGDMSDRGQKTEDFILDLGDNVIGSRLHLGSGDWRIILQSVGRHRKHNLVFPVELPKPSYPDAVQAIQLSGEQRMPATADDGRVTVANPFARLQIGADGEPIINIADIDRYIEYIQEELRRIQEAEVVLKMDLLPTMRTRYNDRKALTIGYRLLVEMLTAEGWREVTSRDVYRTIEDLVKEISWLDIATDRYRGVVAQLSDLVELSSYMSRLTTSSPSHRPIREDDIVEVTGQGFWRYEPLLRAQEATGLDTYFYSINETDESGLWVKVDLNKSVFQAETVSIELPRVQGGPDYRATVWAISEQGLLGPAVTEHTDELRQLYNSRLGFNFHRAISDIYATYQLLMAQIDPSKIDELIQRRMDEIRAIIERAALYGLAPKVEGPYQIAQNPGSTTFVGRNLGSVNQVFLRYTPVGQTTSQTIPATFRVIAPAGAEPSIMITSMPNYADLNPNAPPVLTIEFNAGVRGSDFIAVRYMTNVPRVFSPTVADFAGYAMVTRNAFTLGNTASYFTVELLDGEIERPTPVGPQPRIWPSGGQVMGTLHPVYQAATTDGDEAPSRTIRFSAQNFDPTRMLDVRLRELPNERIVRQAWYGDLNRLNKIYPEPIYTQLEVQQNEIILHVLEGTRARWAGKNFALEFVYYAGEIDPAADNCLGLNIQNLGAHPSTPPGTHANGAYYFDTTAVEYRVRRAGAWVKATPLAFGRHGFSVLSSSQTIVDDTPKVYFQIMAGGYIVQQQSDRDSRFGFTVTKDYLVSLLSGYFHGALFSFGYTDAQGVLNAGTQAVDLNLTLQWAGAEGFDLEAPATIGTIRRSDNQPVTLTFKRWVIRHTSDQTSFDEIISNNRMTSFAIREWMRPEGSYVTIAPVYEEAP